MLMRVAAALMALLMSTSPLWAAEAEARPEATADHKAEIAKMVALRDSLKPLHGQVMIPDAKVTLDLGPKYYFLDAKDAQRVLTEGWGNPPASVEGVLGMIFPEGTTFLGDGWGAVVTYEGTFYVKDSDAKTADYNKLMRDMKGADDESNAARKKAGYEPSTLFGWAEPPSYDSTRHDLIWARDIQFGDQADHALNYDIRHLGRSGVLSLNIVSSMSQLPQIKAAAHDLAQTAEFNAGARYADYQKGDKQAGYGLAGLVAAGAGLAVASKTGLLAAALLFLKKGIVLIIAAATGGAAWFRKMFKKDGAGGPPTNTGGGTVS
jgi:uncharacterized membrane-anchored protein